MKELVANYQGKLLLRDYTDRPVGAGEVKVKVEFGAPKHGTELTCLQDAPFEALYYDEEEHIFKKKEVPTKSGPDDYMTLGNMWVGKIIEMGPEVRGFQMGQRVAGYGPLKNTHIAKAAELLEMPDRMTWQEAVCFDPLQFAMGGIRDSHLRFGDRVLISGLGAIGLMAAQAAKLSGALMVAVSDPIETRRKAALDNGADYAFDPTKVDVGLELRKLTDGLGVDVVIETSGSYVAIEQGLRALAYGGTLACVGWLKECKYPIHLGREGHFNQQKILFSRACSDPNNDYPRWSFDRICREAWQYLEKGCFTCENIIDPIVNFAQCDAGYTHYIIENPTQSVKMGVAFGEQ